MTDKNKMKKLQYKLTKEALRLEEEQSLNFTPKRSRDDAGYDISACIPEPLILPVGKKIHKIPTGIAINLSELEELPSGIVYAVKLHVRSGNPGFALSNQTGIVDQGYQGQIFLKMQNIVDEEITIFPGDRVAQFIVEIATIPDTERVLEFKNKTNRGVAGFNSTGSGNVKTK